MYAFLRWLKPIWTCITTVIANFLRDIRITYDPLLPHDVPRETLPIDTDFGWRYDSSKTTSVYTKCIFAIIPADMRFEVFRELLGELGATVEVRIEVYSAAGTREFSRNRIDLVVADDHFIEHERTISDDPALSVIVIDAHNDIELRMNERKVLVIKGTVLEWAISIFKRKGIEHNPLLSCVVGSHESKRVDLELSDRSRELLVDLGAEDVDDDSLF